MDMMALIDELERIPAEMMEEEKKIYDADQALAALAALKKDVEISVYCDVHAEKDENGKTKYGNAEKREKEK